MESSGLYRDTIAAFVYHRPSFWDALQRVRQFDRRPTAAVLEGRGGHLDHILLAISRTLGKWLYHLLIDGRVQKLFLIMLFTAIFTRCSIPSIAPSNFKHAPYAPPPPPVLLHK